MLLQHDTRRSVGVEYTCNMENRKRSKIRYSEQHLAILFGKLNFISFFFFFVLIMKTNVVSYKLITTSNHQRMSNLDNGVFLNVSVIQSPRVLESPNTNSNPMTPSEVSLRNNVSFLSVYGMLSTNTTQHLPTTTAMSNFVLYLSNKNTNALTSHNTANIMDINWKHDRVIQNIYNLKIENGMLHL